MTAQPGALVLIKIGDGAMTENFTTIGGIRASAMLLNNQPQHASTLESGAWRALLGGAGLQSLTIHGSGIFTDAAAENTLRGYAFSASANNYKFIFAKGDNVTGAFVITSYAREGSVPGSDNYAITLESAGTITYAAS